MLATAKALVLIVTASLHILWEPYENLKGFTHFLSLVRAPPMSHSLITLNKLVSWRHSPNTGLSPNTTPSTVTLGTLTAGVSIIDGLGIEVWKVTASQSDAPSRELGKSTGVSAGWTAAWLLEFRFALPFLSEWVPESRLFSGVPSSLRGWLGCRPALALGWTKTVEGVSAALGWSKGAVSLVSPKQASSAEHGNGCILLGGDFRLSASLAFHLDMTRGETLQSSKGERKFSRDSDHLHSRWLFPCLKRRTFSGCPQIED